MSEHSLCAPPCGVGLKTEAGKQPCGVRRLNLQQQKPQQQKQQGRQHSK
jgi:hypothetical protein